MPQFGSNLSIGAQNRSAVTDSNGNLIVSPDDGFGGSPLGVAARTQALYGIPNANFDILPPDPYTAITVANPLPYWDVAVDGLGTATMSYDDTTQSWAVRLNPTEGTATGETITMKTRTYLLNDSNFTLRQKAFLNLTKVGTQATSEWNLVLSATYYSEAGVQLSTYNIGTANSGSAFTTINGFTTSGTAAIDAAAHYADLAITLTTSGSVAGTAVVDLNSLILQTSTTSQSFVLTQTFTSSGTFTVPTGVNYVTVMALGAGGGGQGGRVTASNTTSATAADNVGGAQSYWALRRDIYVGDVATVSVGIGIGGTGGTATTLNKAAGATTQLTTTPTNPGNAGATTFGTYLSVPGPQSTTAGQVPTGFYGLDSVAPPSLAGTHSISTYIGAPLTTFGTVSNPGTAGSGSGGGNGASGAAGAAAVGAGIAGGGGKGGGGTASSSSSAGAGSAGFIAGSGGGGGAAAQYISATQTVVVTGGNGGNAVANTGGGGGGGGAACVAASSSTNYNASTITLTSGKGGDGATGIVVVTYVA